jgi:RNA polymerase-interacting CarD/CdnL/TRCF family regulator
LEKDVRKSQLEIDLLTRELEKFPKYKITDNKIDYSKIKNEAELIKRLKEEVKQRKLAYENEELKGKILNKEISKMENKMKIQEIISEIFSEATKLEESRLRFSQDEMNYYSFIIKLRNIIFI